MNLNDITYFFLYPEFKDGLLIVKIIFLTFGFIFLLFLNIAFFRTTWLKRILLWDLSEVFTYRAHGIGKFVKKWKIIKGRLQRESESEAKLAVIEADSLLNDVLLEMGYKGESLGERLENLTADLLPNLEDLKKAHATRNNIIHDPYYKLSISEVKDTLEIYEKTLVHLQAL